MLILAIETSCDETSIALLEADKKTGQIDILSNIVSSQIKIHAKWGGVVPSLAAREHLKNLVPVLKKSLARSKRKLEDVDLFAVTRGPGLIPALLIGTNFAKTLSYACKKPLLGIHHLEGHIFANFTGESSKFPALALVVSGGHTQLILMKDLMKYEIVGQTQDDAAGEAFDKVAKLLDLGYPGGPAISAYAEMAAEDRGLLAKNRGNITELPRPMMNSRDLNFSFSGLKTAVLYQWRKLSSRITSANELRMLKTMICYEFQNAVVDVLVAKTIKAAKKYRPRTIILAGGVAANKALRAELETSIKKHGNGIEFITPPQALCGDNAAMIGVAAFHRYRKMFELGRETELENNWRNLEADANMKLESLCN